MRLTDANASLFVSDQPRLQAAQLLAHLLEHQQIVQLYPGSGDDAANFCADFIEQFAKRLVQAKAPLAR